MAVSISIAIAQNSQSIVNNTSNVTVSVNLNWDSGSWNAESPAPPGWLEIDGVTYDFRSTFNENQVSSGSKTLFTQTVDVKHGSNGAKTLSCSASFDSGTGSGTVTATATKTLTTIARASSFTVTCDDSNFPLGTAAKFSISRKDNSFKHTVTYECGSTSGEIETKTDSTSFSWTMPLSLAQQNKTGTSVKVTFKVTTYSGASAIGTAEKEVTCSIPASVAPTCTLKVSEATSYGVYIKDKSKLKIEVTPTKAQGSDIDSYEVIADGVTYRTATVTTGTLSKTGTLTITAKVTDKRGRTGSASTTITVVTASTLSDIANGTLGSSMSIKWTEGHSSFKHRITYTCGSKSGYIVGSSSTYESEATSKSWTPPVSLATENATGTLVAVNIKLTTYTTSGTVVGTSSKAITCAIPASVAPTVSFSVTDDAGCYSKYGAYVQSKSRLSVSVDAAGSQGSSIKSYSASFDGKKYSSSYFSVSSINGKGDLTMTVTVTDSRDRKATATKTLTVLAYSAPKISSLSVKRSSDGSNLIATFSASVTSLNGKNKLVYATEYKKNTASSYSNKQEVTASGASISGAKRTFAADTASTYDVRLTVTDDFGNVYKTAVGSSVKKLWSILAKGTGFAFGKIASRANALDMGWPIYMNNNKITELATPTSDTDAATKAYADGMKDKTFTCGTYNDDYDSAPLGTWWTQPKGGGCANYPEGATYGFLTTLNCGSIYQVYTQYSTGATWVRSRVRNSTTGEDVWHGWFRTDSLDSASKNHTHTAADVGARPNTWTPSASDVGARPNTWMPTASDVGARPNTWTPSASDVGAVKDGLIYKTFSGVSTNAAITDALNTTIAEMTAGTLRYIRIGIGASGLDLTQTAWAVQVYKNSDSYGFAVAQAYGSNTLTQAFNTFYGGEWKGWGFVNPNGNAGSSYRTTERYIGRPVYTKIISFGTTADQKAVDTGLTIANCLIIRYAATLNGTPLPYHYTDTSQDSWVRIYEGSTNYTAMLHTKDVGLSNTYLQVWYCGR